MIEETGKIQTFPFLRYYDQYVCITNLIVVYEVFASPSLFSSLLGSAGQAMLNFQYFVQVLCLVLILRTQGESGETAFYIYF